MSDDTIPDVDDAFVLMRWMSELSNPTPDAGLVAALEVIAEDRGWHPYDAWHALVAAPRDFDVDLHPRGRDGKFIEKFGMVKLIGASTKDKKGQNVDLTGQRGEVQSIAPDPRGPGNPSILVRLQGPDGKPGQVVEVKPQQIVQAPEKGRLDRKPAEAKRLDEDVTPTGYGRGRADVTPPEYGNLGNNRPNGVPAGRDLAEDARLNAEERRLAGEEVRSATDEELASQTGKGPEVWRQAVEKEKGNRAAKRAQQEADRQALIDSINADAATLSTTDAEERARGLDKILAKLRFSIIDTDKVHDHVYPPGESGRWTPERAAQHEQMWDDLLSQVQAAGIPQEHDALVLGGLPGAGKSYMLKPGQKADRFGVVSWEPNGDLPPGATHVSVNPDIVKEMLIQRGMLPEGISADFKPMEQVTFLHEESSTVAKMFSERLGRLGYNVVLDNTMDSEGGMLKRMTPLARQGYKFRGIFADIPIDESLASAKKRYIDSALTPQGGRFVPSSVNDPAKRRSTRGTMSKNRDAMDSLVEQDWFTEYMIVDNTGVSARNPKGDVLAEGTGGGTAADRYLPGADAALPKAGPKPPSAPEPAPTIDVNAPAAAPVV